MRELEWQELDQEVIGIDFGNFNTFPCFISDIDHSQGRLGGLVHDLLPAGCPEGIPSVYFYSFELAEKNYEMPWCGEKGVTNAAIPENNRIRYLKSNIGKTFKVFDKNTVNSKEISYDDAIVQVLQHCVRAANRKMSEAFMKTTNLISIAYPASFDTARRMKLIELAEKATLEDGTHVKVFGTIAEPAAAALNYLAEKVENANLKNEYTVCAYDLGGGTFDISITTVYPNGRTNANGKVYYYENKCTNGIADLGGKNFTSEMINLITNKVAEEGMVISKRSMRQIVEKAESAKKELSLIEETIVSLISTDDDDITVKISREEYEMAVLKLVNKTIKAVRDSIDEAANSGVVPNVIVLTGGACQMPIIEREMRRAFPNFEIVRHKPDKAIAYGAARYGTAENDTIPNPYKNQTEREIGIRFVHSVDDEKGYISNVVTAKTILPYEGEWYKSYTIEDNQRYSSFVVFEAKNEQCNRNEIERDYISIGEIELDRGYGFSGAQGYVSETKINIDSLGVVTVSARDSKNPENVIYATFKATIS